ncbi:hypothetical protein [Nocardia aurea]|jgi:hypothetical protein|uniref:Uncharacterized protein n=2 Tax=Nocardia aurea TaxID=2144174 RepID=A0ABV3FV92_9NOCA
MMTTRNLRTLARTSAAFVAIGAASVALAAPASAANAIDVISANTGTVGVDYSCDANAGVTSVKAMVGEPTAERPAALGVQNAVVCDGTPQTATITIVAAEGEAPLDTGGLMQIRAALVDANNIVVSGQAKIVVLQ